jgi:hypothetical protein
MVAVQGNHDKSAKSVLGTAIPANLTAEQDLAQGLHIITSHPNLAPFISKQLIEHLVTSNPSTDYVGRVSAVFTSSNGNLQQVVQATLLDTEARQGDAPGTPAANSGHLREPLVYIVGLLRALNATVTESNNLAANGTTLGQDLFYAPSVFSYFSPNYHVGALAGPEFQIQTPSTANLRGDFVNTLVYGSLGGGTTIDLTPYVTLASNSGSLLDALDAALMHGQMPTDMRSTIQTALAAQTTAKLKAQAAIYLVASSSQYQVEH